MADWRSRLRESIDQRARDVDAAPLRSLGELLGPISDLVAEALADPPDTWEEEFVCRRCRDAGYVKDRRAALVLCRCEVAQSIAVTGAGISRGEYAAMTFNTFTPADANQADMVDAVRRWVESPSAFLCLLGARGRGKTHLAVAALRHWCERGREGRFVVVAEWLDRLQATMRDGALETRDQVLAPVLGAPLLVLDDYGAERDTPWRAEELFKCVNHRYTQGLPTVITSNLWPPDRMEPRLASRVSDRRNTLLVTDGPDVRIQGAGR